MFTVIPYICLFCFVICVYVYTYTYPVFVCLLLLGCAFSLHWCVDGAACSFVHCVGAVSVITALTWCMLKFFVMETVSPSW